MTASLLSEVAAAAISATASPARVTNDGFSRKSAGGYPHTASSENSTTSAWALAAFRAKSMIFRVFPSKSPTVGLIWARAIFTCTVYQLAGEESGAADTATEEILNGEDLPRRLWFAAGLPLGAGTGDNYRERAYKDLEV